MAETTGGLDEKMSEYIGEGMSLEETEELLLADGYDPDLVKSCSSRYSKASPISSISRWGFHLGNQKGKTISHIELDAAIEATDEADATEQLTQMIMDSGKDATFTEILAVFRID